MSRYIGDDNLWKIKPFSIKENKLAFSNINPSQVDTFIEGNIAKRELIIDGINENSKKIIFKNYDDETEKENILNEKKKKKYLANSLKILDVNDKNKKEDSNKFLRCNYKKYYRKLPFSTLFN